MTETNEQTRTADVAAPQSGAKRSRAQKVEPYHRAMLEAVAAGVPVEDAAKGLGLSRRTGQRWAQRHAAELRQARAAVVDSAVGQFAAALPLAFRTLQELAAESAAAAKATAPVRLEAALGIVGAYCALTGKPPAPLNGPLSTLLTRSTRAA